MVREGVERRVSENVWDREGGRVCVRERERERVCEG